MQPIEQWFAQAGWAPFPFQREVWEAFAHGESGLIHSATGTGKTLAAWGGPLNEAPGDGLQVLWITPLRALAADTADSLLRPVRELGLTWTVELRTGDTTASQRARQTERLPNALVTTPESLTLMLAREDAPTRFGGLRCVVVDEWHELLGSKRGVQTELALAMLRTLSPELRVWGVSATLGNLDEAMACLLGPGRKGRLVRGELDKQIVIDTILPENMHRFPWAGHFGTQMIPHVIDAIAEGGTCLIFTNTRAMAEVWHQTILDARPDWTGEIGLHHGSLDRKERDLVEAGLKSGSLRAVVCTSSLDLGVDFSPVDRVLQVGSPKGVARLLQRAGRSGHRPGVPSRVTCVPTHAFELVDIASARRAAAEGRIEAREPIRNPMDVLVQHLVTRGLAGFREDALLQEVRSTFSYQDLTLSEWDWALDFVATGGASLGAYREHRRLARKDGECRVANEEIAQRHRMSVGTIVSDAAMNVQLMNGARLGTVEESFLARLRPGDRFVFAGKGLEFVRIRDMTAWVRRAKSLKGLVPRWGGGRLPLSNQLAAAIRQSLERARDGEIEGPEMECVAPILEVQARWSAIPGEGQFLVEQVESREGFHLFFYPFEGRLVHEGLAALFAYRIARESPITFSVACNDYGFELLAERPLDIDEESVLRWASPHGLAQDVVASLNSVELARRQFREIARIAGLVFQGFPGQHRTAKQVQASSGLFFDVFERYDPENMLLKQSHSEVLERQLEQSRLAKTLLRLSRSEVLLARPPRPTPMAFPILVDRLRETVTSETLGDRIERMSLMLDQEAGP